MDYAKKIADEETHKKRSADADDAKALMMRNIDYAMDFVRRTLDLAHLTQDDRQDLEKAEQRFQLGKEKIVPCLDKLLEDKPIIYKNLVHSINLLLYGFAITYSKGGLSDSAWISVGRKRADTARFARLKITERQIRVRDKVLPPLERFPPVLQR